MSREERARRRARERALEAQRIRRRRRFALVGMLALALAIALIGGIRLLVGALTSPNDPAAANDTNPYITQTPGVQSQIRSTPRSEWHQGQMPYLFQIDPQYAEHAYSNGSFAKQGCGPTSLATAYIYLTGKTDMGPIEMAEWATQSGYSTDRDGSAWDIVGEGAQSFGLEAEGIEVSAEAIRSAVAGNDSCAIAVVGPGTFTEVGHFITIEGTDADGKLIVHDSNSVERSLDQHWDAELVAGEAYVVWRVTRADS